MITSEELNRMMVEISMGLAYGDRRSKIPRSPEHRRQWQRLQQQMDDIERRGHSIDIPHEIPDLNEYTPGTV